MAYITARDYAEYGGTSIDESIFDRIAARASDEIDRLTMQQVRINGLSYYDEDTQESIKKATCAMAEALAQIDTATDSTGIPATSEKVGSYSYSVDSTSLTALKADARAAAMEHLLYTGLLYRGL